MMHTVTILHPATDRGELDDLRGEGYQYVDGWASALEDLHKLNALDPNPTVYDESELDEYSRYIVFPWRRTIVRVPDDEIFHRLRTARNCYLITDEEQHRWSSATIAIAGLSVGASILSVCALSGARRFRLADPDTLGPSNLNRLVGSVCDLGVPKTTLAYRRVIEADPYATVDVFPDGFNADTAADFIGGGLVSTPAVILEEMDDIARKVELRRLAKTAGVAVIMVTDDGDDVIVDVERYDLDPDYPLFHGRAGELLDLTEEQLQDKDNRVELAGRIVGHDVDNRLKVALAQVGVTIPSWPQLGTAASLAGVVGAVAARKLVCGDDLPSGRCHIRASDLALQR
ncbi:ThiF family adenylyltransferase [Gordonia bronchialis]|uniref:ThiF family adenylyltransferase n=1 Tax=Gordonia bronchialis TaxID=2054 RepID=UPI00227050AB|nr:ThiF family adenylyltransferase [Gordonia bronchialis]